MIQLFGIVSKNKTDISNKLLECFPKKRNLEKILVFDEKFLVSKELNKKELKELKKKRKVPPSPEMGVGYCRNFFIDSNKILLNTDKKNLSNYLLLYGNLWNKKVPPTTIKGLRNADGSYIGVMKKGKRIILIKDRIGNRQLYLGENDEMIAFSTRKETFAKLNIEPTRWDPENVVELSEKGIKFIESNPLEIPSTKIYREMVALNEYKRAYNKAIGKRTKDIEKAGLYFPGGVDSAMLAFSLIRSGVNIFAYYSALSGSKEYKKARRTAGMLAVPLKVSILNKGRVGLGVSKAMKAIENSSQFQIEHAIQEYYAFERAAKDGVKVMFVPQGIDELFGGYPWYINILKKENEAKFIERMKEDVHYAYFETFERLNKLAEYFDILLSAHLKCLKSDLIVSQNRH